MRSSAGGVTPVPYDWYYVKLHEYAIVATFTLTHPEAGTLISSTTECKMFLGQNEASGQVRWPLK